MSSIDDAVRLLMKADAHLSADALVSYNDTLADAATACWEAGGGAYDIGDALTSLSHRLLDVAGAIGEQKMTIQTLIMKLNAQQGNT